MKDENIPIVKGKYLAISVDINKYSWIRTSKLKGHLYIPRCEILHCYTCQFVIDS